VADVYLEVEKLGENPEGARAFGASTGGPEGAPAYRTGAYRTRGTTVLVDPFSL
jgi:hypothetical protein